MLHFFLLSTAFSLNCSDAKPFQMLCEAKDCNLDESVTGNCSVFHSVLCDGERTFIKTYQCRYCYQMPEKSIECDKSSDCQPGIKTYSASCHSKELCMGNTIFSKRSTCKASSLSQKTAFLLSLFLGGFGVDRFYLGYTSSGVMKLATLGGLGIVYMADLFLILFGYLGPADGSLFPERV